MQQEVVLGHENKHFFRKVFFFHTYDLALSSLYKGQY